MAEGFEPCGSFFGGFFMRVMRFDGSPHVLSDRRPIAPNCFSYGVCVRGVMPNKRADCARTRGRKEFEKGANAVKEGIGLGRNSNTAAQAGTRIAPDATLVNPLVVGSPAKALSSGLCSLR